MIEIELGKHNKNLETYTKRTQTYYIYHVGRIKKQLIFGEIC